MGQKAPQDIKTAYAEAQTRRRSSSTGFQILLLAANLRIIQYWLQSRDIHTSNLARDGGCLIYTGIIVFPRSLLRYRPLLLLHQKYVCQNNIEDLGSISAPLWVSDNLFFGSGGLKPSFSPHLWLMELPQHSLVSVLKDSGICIFTIHLVRLNNDQLNLVSPDIIYLGSYKSGVTSTA